MTLTKYEENDLKNLPVTYLICHFNAFPEAVNKLHESKPFLKSHSPEYYNLYKESQRILRKVQYN